jgi:hypothetical protein
MNAPAEAFRSQTLAKEIAAELRAKNTDVLFGSLTLYLVDVRFGSKADIFSAKTHVRFTPESDTERVFTHVR